jgi:hypothetical protein
MSRPGLPQPTLGQAPVVPATGLPCMRHSREPNIGQNALFPGLFENGISAEDNLHVGARRPDPDDESTVIHAITGLSVLSCGMRRSGRLAGPAQGPHRSHRPRQHPKPRRRLFAQAETKFSNSLSRSAF